MSATSVSHSGSDMKLDPVLQTAVALNLTEYEADLRRVVNMVKSTPTPTLRDLVIAATAVLMQIGRVPWPTIMQALTALKTRSDEDLQTDAIGLLNGSHLVVPVNGPAGVAVYDLATTLAVDEPPPALVSTIYGVNISWQLIAKAISEAK
jgi:hypothetical protein